MNYTDYRLRVMDYLLHSRKDIHSRQLFTNMVNDRVVVKGGEEIGLDMLSKNIKALNELAEGDGVKVAYTKTRGYHYDKPGYRVFEDFITDEEKKLLSIATSVFSIFRGTPLQEKFRGTMQKLVSETASGTLDKLTMQVIEFGAGVSHKGTQWISYLLNAIIEERCIEMQYKSIRYKEAKKKIISPYLLKQYLDRWYLIAYEHTSSQSHKTLVFSLDGIRSLKDATENYFLDPDFSPRDYFKYSIGVWHWHERPPEVVKLEFNDYIEMIQNTPLHHTQKSKLSEDGSRLNVEMIVYPSPELEMLIQGYGDKVKVIAPEWLADKIRERAQRVLDMYSK